MRRGAAAGERDGGVVVFLLLQSLRHKEPLPARL